MKTIALSIRIALVRSSADRPRDGRPIVDRGEAINLNQPLGPRFETSRSTTAATNSPVTGGTYFSADKLIKQRSLNGSTWYLVRWSKEPRNERYPDRPSWEKAVDVTAELKTQFLIGHTKVERCALSFAERQKVR
jgi:hypothetical protein